MSDTATVDQAGAGQEPMDEPLPRIIAVDGSAASGKSSVGRRIATHLRYPFLDTGVMYRAVTWAALQRRINLSDADALTSLANGLNIEIQLPDPRSSEPSRISIDGSDVTDKLRLPEVDDAVSLVSRVPGVREALVRKQREIAGRQPIVMVGRDIGTVVLPDADLKVYLDASIEERARRRHRDFAETGHAVTEEDVLQDIRRRDQIDSEREVSPLRPAPDAVIISTDGMDLNEVFQRVVDLLRER